MGSELLRTRDQEILLRNAHRMLRRTNQYRKTVLWVFVSDITAFGATYSDQVCRELGWNPNAPVCDDLPPRAAQETFAEPVDGVVCGSELELQIQLARKAIDGWPDDVKRAMKIEGRTGDRLP